MKFFVILLFCFYTVRTIPVVENPDDPFLILDEIDAIEAEYLNSRSRNLKKKSASNHCPNLADSRAEDFEQPSRLSLPTLMTLSGEDEPRDFDVNSAVSEIIYQPLEVMLPNEFGPKPAMPPMGPPSPWNNWMNEMISGLYESEDPLPGLSNGLPSQKPWRISENTITSVRSLPPVSMRIHESLSEVENNYEPDSQVMDNSLYLTPDQSTALSVRAVRSREEEQLEELLEQLQHDAMIPNIIPTMPVPFVRTSELPEYQPNKNTHLVMVFFPGRVPDCSLPFLFGCSPNISYGQLAQVPYDDSTALQVVSGPEYRKDTDTVKSDEVEKNISESRNEI